MCFLKVISGQADGTCEMEDIWKTVALPRFLAYVDRRHSDFQSWLSSQEKREGLFPWGEKHTDFSITYLTFSPGSRFYRFYKQHTSFGILVQKTL